MALQREEEARREADRQMGAQLVALTERLAAGGIASPTAPVAQEGGQVCSLQGRTTPLPQKQSLTLGSMLLDGLDRALEQAAPGRQSAEPVSPVEHAVEVDSDEDGDAEDDDGLIKAHGAFYREPEASGFERDSDGLTLPAAYACPALAEQQQAACLTSSSICWAVIHKQDRWLNASFPHNGVKPGCAGSEGRPAQQTHSAPRMSLDSQKSETAAALAASPGGKGPPPAQTLSLQVRCPPACGKACTWHM